MSVLTEVLKLFKYDPATDGDMTFNIGQCMNDNWDKLDAALLLAIAAAGAYNPEESYAVGDYCTYKGKLRKCSTAIPTGETWTEAHWTTTTVAAELAELSSQLSNKQNVLSLGVADADVDVNTLTEIGTVAVPGSATNLPPDITSANWGLLTVSANTENGQSGCTQHLSITVSEGYFPQVYERNFNGINWSNWARIATATPPQTFNLPMAESFTAYPGYACIYYKTQFGEIGIQIIAQYVGMGAIGIKLLAILPEGFRPAYHCEFPMLVNFDGQQSIALITVDADGGIYLHSYSSSTDNGAAVSGYARFIAAN